MKPIYFLIIVFLFTATLCSGQNIGINATGAAPNAKAILDISDTSKGLLIPRLTTLQRDAITSPPTGLQIYNTTTNTFELYTGSNWQFAITAPTHNLVHVYSLTDLPTAAGGVITLVAGKMYVIHGIINISPNSLNLNGANLRGIDPARDGIMSSVSGAVLKSTGVSVFLENLAVIPLTSATKAYEFADATGTQFCNIFSGCSVVEIGVPTLGVGEISGFKAITIIQNYWNCADGIKITGALGKLCVAYTFITGISSGSGIELMSALSVDDIDLSNNYFIYTGQTGVKLNAGASVDRGRMTTNMLRGVGTALSGFDSYSPSWTMQQNAGIDNSRAYAFVHMNNNNTATALPVTGTYYKISGTTTSLKQQKFIVANNKITYSGKESITAKVFVVVGGKSPANGTDFSITIAKNGVNIPFPNSSMGSMVNNQGFQIVLETEVDLSINDYVEVYINSNNGSANSLVVSDMQFRVND